MPPINEFLTKLRDDYGPPDLKTRYEGNSAFLGFGHPMNPKLPEMHITEEKARTMLYDDATQALGLLRSRLGGAFGRLSVEEKARMVLPVLLNDLGLDLKVEEKEETEPETPEPTGTEEPPSLPPVKKKTKRRKKADAEG